MKKSEKKYLSDFYLTDNEINKLIEKGIIIESILNPHYIKSQYGNGYYLYGAWKENGIVKAYNTEYNYRDAICITDFHLFIIKRKLEIKGEDKFDINVIPLQEIESIEIVEQNSLVTTKSHEVRKNPAKGAIIGATVAGTTGAVVGAAMNSGTKIVGGGTSRLYNWDLVIKFENNIQYYVKDISHFLSPRESLVKRENDKLSELVKRSKEHLTDEEKANIVNATVNTKKGCYVATCVYGSYDCPEVWTLRRFRDNYLDKHIFGKIFIKTYYKISPKLVKLFGNSKTFKLFNKRILDKFVLKLKSKGYQDTFYNDNY